jgi:integrase
LHTEFGSPPNRKIAEAQAVLIDHEIEHGTFDYLRWFPQGNKAEHFKQTVAPTMVGEYYVIWIERKKPPLVREGLEYDYRRQFSRYILPKFASCELAQVTPKLLEAFRTYLLTELGLSLKSCRNIIDGTFRAMMRDARIIDQLIDKDPFEFLRWPRIRRPKPDPFTEEERDKILAPFKGKNPFYYPFVYTQFWTGMRPSEAIALRWGDVDFQTEADLNYKVALSRRRKRDKDPCQRANDSDTSRRGGFVEKPKAASCH